MTIINAPLPENVFPYPSMPPGKDDADSNGNVLWFHPVHGWHQCMWRCPAFTGSTHWTYLPLVPPAQESASDKCDRLFSDWLTSFNHSFDESTTALIKLGWTGAFKKLQQLP